jgi:replication factor A1
MNVMDYTGGFWVTAFNEVAEQIMGISANDLMSLKDANEAQFSKYFNKAMGSEWTLQMMAKQDSFNVSWENFVLTNSQQDQVRVRYQCRRAAPVDFVADSAALIQQISSMSV